MTKFQSRKRLSEIAQLNRQKLLNNPTKAEVRFKYMLKKMDVPFFFQFIIFGKTSFFIADFLVTNKEGKKYVIELDGGYHFTHKQKRTDKNRSSKIRTVGQYGVIRFKNDDVFKNTEKVVKKLKRFKIV